jgi:hypothetical protein
VRKKFCGQNLSGNRKKAESQEMMITMMDMMMVLASLEKVEKSESVSEVRRK